MSERKEVKCARCKCGLEGPLDPQPHDRIACPRCGEGDTVERVMAEVGEYMQEQAAHALHKAVTHGFGSSEFFKVKTKLPPKGKHRFVIDMNL